MSRRTLIVRADASQSIGVGHVLRSLAIAQQWRRNGGVVCFAAAEMPRTMQERLVDEGMRCQMLSSLPGSLDDARELVELAKHTNANAIVLDGYQFSSDYQSVIESFRGCTLLIDDHAHLEQYTADLILNQNLGATAGMYGRKADSSQLLLGPEFALIRDEFLVAQNHAKLKRGPVRNILVTLGGSDPSNATRTVVDGLQSVSQTDLQFRVIVGQLNPNRDSLFARVESDNRFTLMDHVGDMSEQYRWADFAVAAGGSSNWEMCYFGIPRLVVVIAGNQIQIASSLAKRGIAVNLGNADGLNAEALSAATVAALKDTDFLNAAKSAASSLVDGLGGQRCVDAMNRFFESKR